MAFNPAESNHSDTYSATGGRFEQPNFRRDAGKDKSSGIGPPPSSDWEDDTRSKSASDMSAPPLAIPNLQHEYLSQTLFKSGYSESKPQTVEQPAPAAIATMEPLTSDGVAGAIKRAAQQELSTVPELTLTLNDSQPAPRSRDIYSNEAGGAAPIAQLLKMRTPADSSTMKDSREMPIPKDLYQARETAANEAARINNIGIGVSDGMPQYREQKLGRLPELARLEKTDTGLDNLNGSPEGYLFATKLDLANKFKGSDTKYTRVVDAKGTTEIQTAGDFSTMHTSYGEDGACNTSHFDSYRRPLTRVSERYNEGNVEYNMVQYLYSDGAGGKVSPFPKETREINYADGKAVVDHYDHTGIKAKLLSSETWS